MRVQPKETDYHSEVAVIRWENGRERECEGVGVREIWGKRRDETTGDFRARDCMQRITAPLRRSNTLAT